MNKTTKDFRKIAGAAVFVLLIFAGLLLDQKIGIESRLDEVGEEWFDETELTIEAWMLDTNYLADFIDKTGSSL